MMKWKPLRVLVIAAIGLALTGVPPVMAEDEPSGYLSDFLQDFSRASEKLVELAEAIPADKYGWRPTEEVRTVSEVYMHVAGANFYFARDLGIPLPEDLPEELEKEVTTKAEVIKVLKRSQDRIRQAVEKSDGDVDRKIDFFGRDWTIRRLYMLVAAHTHEHLGQGIAYARSMGVVPPWSQAN